MSLIQLTCTVSSIRKKLPQRQPCSAKAPASEISKTIRHIEELTDIKLCKVLKYLLSF